MLDFFKRLFGAPPPPTRPEPGDALAALDAANIALGQQIDELRDRRRVLRQKADALRAEREAEAARRREGSI